MNCIVHAPWLIHHFELCAPLQLQECCSQRLCIPSEIYNPRPGSIYHSNLAVRVLYDTSMLLYPSSRDLWNTTFCNMEGQIIFQTESLMLLGSPHQINIKRLRVLPLNSIDLATGNEDALRVSFSGLAEIHYNFLSSRIRYNGTEMAATQFFRKTGFLGRWELQFDCLQIYSISHHEIYRQRTFKGPGGKEYEWELGTNGCNVISDHSPIVAYWFTTVFPSDSE